MYILSIEGNIGTGKSTVIRIIKEIIDNINNKAPEKQSEEYRELIKLIKKEGLKYSDIEIITEPVSKWLQLIDDDDNENILDKFYKNQERWSYSFQMNAFITRAKDIMEFSNKKLIIIERSVLTDRNVFAKLLFSDKKISTLEWKLYNEWFEWLTSAFNILPNKIIYLKASPDISYKRIQKRSRKEEASIPFNYIKSVSDAHDKWLENHLNLTTIDVNDDFEHNLEKKSEIIKTIFREINTLLK